jgi:GWxTD domain-containing protein
MKSREKEVSKMRQRTFLAALMLMLLWLGPAAANAGAQEKIDDDASLKTASKLKKAGKNVKPGKDFFFPIARLIMTKEEIQIYKNLSTIPEKVDFIEEFWKKRDPTPNTEENESRDEFYLRVAYANKWFKEGTKGRGWDTERGRILLQLGFPDKREFREVPITRRGRLLTSKRIPMERWYYFRYQLVLVFQDANDSGHLRLTVPPSNLPYALDQAKFAMDITGQTNAKKNRSFKFEAEYKADHFEISIPVQKVSFEETQDHQMNVDFGITVYVYRNHHKVDEFNIPKSVSLDKEKLLQMKSIQFEIPYKVSEKGKYFFDVVIEEMSSASKFRDFIKYKI